MPRVHLRVLLLAVAAIGLEFAAMRALWRVKGTLSRVVLLGVLPMSNVVAMAAWAAVSRRRGRAFLTGFVASGLAAMAASLAWAWLSPDGVVSWWQGWIFSLRRHLGLDGRGWRFALLVAIASAVWVVPQLVLAACGGLLLESASRIIKAESTAPGLSSRR